MEARVGSCGWSFPDWKGPFYPPDTKDQLAYYATQFDAVEVDSTWYGVPSQRAVESWARRTPENFVFCPKLPGEITHENLLEESDEVLSRFLSVISLLGDKLGPILVQLAPKFTYEQMETLHTFLVHLPTEHRYAVEFRHRSWLKRPDALALLTDLNAGVVMAEHPWYPRLTDVTTDFTYLRLLGRRDVFPDFSRLHRRQDTVLGKWAEHLRTVSPGVNTAYVFANNQFEGHSPETARRLRGLLQPTP
jgi:uncharacterized protein YecE (DUF72 family)